MPNKDDLLSCFHTDSEKQAFETLYEVDEHKAKLEAFYSADKKSSQPLLRALIKSHEFGGLRKFQEFHQQVLLDESRVKKLKKLTNQEIDLALACYVTTPDDFNRFIKKPTTKKGFREANIFLSAFQRAVQEVPVRKKFEVTAEFIPYNIATQAVENFQTHYNVSSFKREYDSAYSLLPPDYGYALDRLIAEEPNFIDKYHDTDVIVLSLDYDGCIGDGDTLEAALKNNKALIAKIVLLLDAGKTVHLTVGSNRQDLYADSYNSYSHGTPSVYSVLEAVVQKAKKLTKKGKITFEPILDVDTANGRHVGETYKKYKKVPYIKKGLVPKTVLGKDDNCSGDETKISSLYNQIHELARRYPNKKLEFTFVDDREDLLDGVNQFFSNYPHLLPRNLTLKLQQHKSIGNTVGDIAAHKDREEKERELREREPEKSLPQARSMIFEKKIIQGTGDIDQKPAETTRALQHVLYKLLQVSQNTETVEDFRLKFESIKVDNTKLLETSDFHQLDLDHLRSVLETSKRHWKRVDGEGPRDLMLTFLGEKITAFKEARATKDARLESHSEVEKAIFKAIARLDGFAADRYLDLLKMVKSKGNGLEDILSNDKIVPLLNKVDFLHKTLGIQSLATLLGGAYENVDEAMVSTLSEISSASIEILRETQSEKHAQYYLALSKKLVDKSTLDGVLSRFDTGEDKKTILDVCESLVDLNDIESFLALGRDELNNSVQLASEDTRISYVYIKLLSEEKPEIAEAFYAAFVDNKEPLQTVLKKQVEVNCNSLKAIESCLDAPEDKLELLSALVVGQATNHQFSTVVGFLSKHKEDSQTYPMRYLDRLADMSNEERPTYIKMLSEYKKGYGPSALQNAGQYFNELYDSESDRAFHYLKLFKSNPEYPTVAEKFYTMAVKKERESLDKKVIRMMFIVEQADLNPDEEDALLSAHALQFGGDLQTIEKVTEKFSTNMALTKDYAYAYSISMSRKSELAPIKTEANAFAASVVNQIKKGERIDSERHKMFRKLVDYYKNRSQDSRGYFSFWRKKLTPNAYSKTTKLSACKKAMAWLAKDKSEANTITFSSDEISALQDGRLSKIMKEYPALKTAIERAPNQQHHRPK